MKKRLIDEHFADFGTIHAVMTEAFPPDELIPTHYLVEGWGRPKEFYAFYDEQDTLAGLYFGYLFRDITYMMYLVVPAARRGQGIGARLLEEVRALHPDNRILADIEVLDDHAGNNAQRIRRRDFYLRNGFADTGLTYTLNGVDYSLLLHGDGTLTQEDFQALWDDMRRED